MPIEAAATAASTTAGERPTTALLALVPTVDAGGGGGLRAAATRVPLGAAESKVALLAAEGFSVLNISARLGSAESTVRTHLRRVYLKLGVHSRVELASLLLRGVR